MFAIGPMIVNAASGELVINVSDAVAVNALPIRPLPRLALRYHGVISRWSLALSLFLVARPPLRIFATPWRCREGLLCSRVVLLALFVHTPPHTFGIEQGSACHITPDRLSRLAPANVSPSPKVPFSQSKF